MKTQPIIKRVELSDQRLLLLLTDGQVISCSMERYPELKTASGLARYLWTISLDGSEVRWARLGIVVRIADLQRRAA